MKKILSLVLFCGIAFFAGAQSIQQDISDKVKITFPGKPEENQLPNGPKVFSYKKDSVEAYMGMAFDLSAMGLTEDMITSAGDALWDQIKQGIVSQMAGAVIAKDELLDFKGKKALYLEIDGKGSGAPQLAGKKALGYLFFTGTILHQVLYYSGNPAMKKKMPMVSLTLY